MPSRPFVSAPALRLGVAGVRFVLSGPDDLVVHEDDPPYRPFLSPPDDGDWIDVAVDLEITQSLTTAGLRPVFETDDTWSLQTDGRDHCFVLHPPAAGDEPIWVARATPDWRNVHLQMSERYIDVSGGRRRLANPLHYPLDQLLVMAILAHHQGVVLHAAGLVSGGGAMTFAGVSGAGKTTLARLFDAHSEATLLSDDRVAVRRGDDQWLASGTPWPGDAGIASPTAAPLRTLCFLTHAASDELRPLTSIEAVDRLLPVTSIPWFLPAARDGALAVCERLIEEVDCYEARFAPGPGIVERLLAVGEELRS